jgi:hypothetical protein
MTMKTLILTAATVLLLGAGVVMVQGEVPGVGQRAYFSQWHQAAPQTGHSGSGQLQSGSTEAEATRPQSRYPGARSGLITFGS